MIVEVRSYRTKPERRDEFIRLFESRTVPAQQACGMGIVGPLLDKENPNRFIWLRSFPSMAAREEMKKAFYGGDPWQSELANQILPMLDSYDVSVCETSAGFVFDGF